MLSGAFQPRGGTVALPLGHEGDSSRGAAPSTISPKREMEQSWRRVGVGCEEAWYSFGASFFVKKESEGFA